MNTERVERGFTELNGAWALMDNARQFVETWPDVFSLARQAAGEYLREHHPQSPDPDQVWWHVFDNATNGPTFTGWRHTGKPRLSLTFTQLWISRFDEGFQWAVDLLPVYGGFYRQDGSADTYGADNQLELDPIKVKEDIRALDFAARVEQRTADFWALNGSAFEMLAKVSFVQQIQQSLKQGYIEPFDAERLRAWLGLEAEGPVGLETLRDNVPDSRFKIRQYEVQGGGHLLTLTTEDGRILLYTPTAPTVLQAFAGMAQLVAWVRERVSAPDAQHWFDQLHSPGWLASAAERREFRLRRAWRGRIPVSPWWPFGPGVEVTGDLFAQLLRMTQDDLNAQHRVIVSNEALDRQRWHDYITAATRVFGSFTLLFWPFSLFMVGLGMVSMALDVQASLVATNEKQRWEAFLSVFADALVVVLASLDVVVGVSAVGYRATPQVLKATPKSWLPVGATGEELAPFASTRRAGNPIQTPGRFQGVEIDAQGATWIEMNDVGLRTRFDTQLDSWVVTHERAPYGLMPALPVRLGEGGAWQLLAPEGDLDALVTDFWNVYMDADEVQSQALARRIEAQQRALLRSGNLPEFVGHMAPMDAHGNPCVTVNGTTHYTFWHEGDVHNSLLEQYSGQMSKINDLFSATRPRPTFVQLPELMHYLDNLFASMAELPRSTAPLLWRGVRGGRSGLAAHYRAGAVGPGDLLVSTDITSFTENPYIPRRFMVDKSAVGRPLAEITGQFDEHTVLYELVNDGKVSGVPVAPMTQWQESEVLFTPGRLFRIESVRDIAGQHYRFLRFRLREVEQAQGERVFDMRSGLPFDRQAYLERVQYDKLVERCFPASQWPEA
jgi:hypothetical protein